MGWWCTQKTTVECQSATSWRVRQTPGCRQSYDDPEKEPVSGVSPLRIFHFIYHLVLSFSLFFFDWRAFPPLCTRFKKKENVHTHTYKSWVKKNKIIFSEKVSLKKKKILTFLYLALSPLYFYFFSCHNYCFYFHYSHYNHLMIIIEIIN